MNASIERKPILCVCGESASYYTVDGGDSKTVCNRYPRCQIDNWGIWVIGFGDLAKRPGWWWPDAMRYEASEPEAKAAAYAANFADRSGQYRYEARPLAKGEE